MSVVFDKENKVILIKSPQTKVTIQALVNAIRAWEFKNMAEASFIKTSGGQDLLDGTKVVITLTLLDNWRIQFEDRPGPEWIACTILGGNLITTNDYGNNPIKHSAYTHITVVQPFSATILNIAPEK